MIVIPARNGWEISMVSFRRGEYIVEELTEYLEKVGADTGLITSGIGSTDICKIHTILDTGLPPKERFTTIEGPGELSSVLGNVAGGVPHIHVTVHDVLKNEVHSGHLEPGTRCCYRVEIGLILFKDVRTVRQVFPETGLIDIIAAE